MEKRLMQRAIWLAAAGILFGVFASISFCVFQPWLQEQMKVEKEITIPKDEEPEEHPREVTAEEVKEPKLTLENFEEMEQALYQVALGANKSIVSVTSVKGNDSWTEEEHKEGTGGMWRTHAVQQQGVSDSDDEQRCQRRRENRSDICGWSYMWSGGQTERRSTWTCSTC
ncbi:hypothetical protein, secreted, partial [gut metagenome]